MFSESRLINSVYAAGHGMIQAKLNVEQKAHEQAAERLAEAGSRRSATHRGEQREFAKAKARFRRAQEHAREQAASLQSIIRSWGDGKQEDRVGWCQALHTVVSRGKGMGSILFHAFPQEVIDSIAARTGGIRTQVQCPAEQVRIVVEHDCLYSLRGEWKEFLLRMDGGTQQIVRDG